MALVDFHDKNNKIIKSGEYTIDIFIDLQKTFDTINHSILLQKLSYYGIRRVALDWLSDYLKTGNNMFL